MNVGRLNGRLKAAVFVAHNRRIYPLTVFISKDLRPPRIRPDDMIQAAIDASRDTKRFRSRELKTTYHSQVYMTPSLSESAYCKWLPRFAHRAKVPWTTPSRPNWVLGAGSEDLPVTNTRTIQRGTVTWGTPKIL